MPAAELDVLAGAGEGPDGGAGPADAPLQCVLAVCGRARAGLAADLLDALGARHPGLRLGGLTGTTLHGTSVSLLLLRRDPHDDGPGGRPDVAATVAAVAADHPDDRLVAPAGGVAERGAAGTPPGPGDGPLIRVHLRSPDRLALVAAALDAVRTSLAAATGTDARYVLAWHARGLVTDARTATLRLVLRLPDEAAGRRLAPGALGRAGAGRPPSAAGRRGGLGRRCPAPAPAGVVAPARHMNS